MARKVKGSNNWFMGAITNENSRNTNVNLRFLVAGKKYTAIIYADAPDADHQKNPAAYLISKQLVDSKTVLSLKLVPGGGCAISIMPVK